MAGVIYISERLSKKIVNAAVVLSTESFKLDADDIAELVVRG